MLKARWSDKFSVSSVSNASFLSCSCTLWLGAVLDLINPIWKFGINFGKGWEKKKAKSLPREDKNTSPGIAGSRFLLGKPSWLYLWAFQTRHSHQDVVEVGAAPPQHVHPHLVPLLPQLVDGIFRAAREWTVSKNNKGAAKNLVLGMGRERKPLFGV